MADPTAATVSQYTSGRLAADAKETKRLLSAGLSAARRFCGWHVTPVIALTGVKRNGSGSELLVLRTLNLVTLDSITENGIAIDPDDVVEDADAPGHLYKRSGAAWSRGRSNIEVSYSHGFEDADDFNAAVLSFVDRSSLAAAGGRAKVVGPFQYDSEVMADGSTFSVAEKSLLELFRLESPA